MAHQLLADRGLERFYDLRGERGAPPAPRAQVSAHWLATLESRQALSPDGCPLEVDVQGITCSACVWLIQRLFDEQPGALSIIVNPALGSARVLVTSEFSFAPWIEDLARAGYALGPARKGSSQSDRSLQTRLGVSAAMTLNVMSFSLAIYFGLDEPGLLRVLSWLSLAAAAVAIAVGLPVFLRPALAALRRGHLHFDLPISIGIVLAAGLSVIAVGQGHFDAMYFDSVCAFVTLMLLGRVITARALQRSRNRLLAGGGMQDLWARIDRNGAVELIAAEAVVPGDRLQVFPGEIAPVSGTLLDREASLSYEWISGESRARTAHRGQHVPAGAANAGTSRVALRAEESLAESALPGLLERAPRPPRPGFLDQLARIYTPIVLSLATAAFVLWYELGGDLSRALGITTAVLVVTCPCAFGIAIPLAQDLVRRRLEREGLYIREPDFLERAAEIDTLVFDKTGTLTTGIAVLDTAALHSLEPEEREILTQLCIQSSHPKADALRRALLEGAPAALGDGVAREVPGCGLELRRSGATYRLGRRQWASEGEGGDKLVFSRDGEVLASFDLGEELRPGARQDAMALGSRYRLAIASGDQAEFVDRVATDLNIADAHGGLSPSDKASLVRELGSERVLFVGDGINDNPALDAAQCSGTPASHRPLTASHCDFYLTSPGLRPLRSALYFARRLRLIRRRTVVLASIYNGAAVALALAGAMPPWLAAIAMPVSSLLAIGYVGMAVERTSPCSS